MALRFAEELLLLILNEDYGDLAPVPEPHLNHALAGAVLMDLALENRIDTDPEKLILVDSTPVKDELLDPTPAGRPLFVATTVTHRLPECFPDPDRFDIDCYSPERAEHRQPNAYVPFGVGTHRCLGAGFAEVQTLLTLAVILREAELVLDPPDYELEMTNVPTPRPAKSFKFKVASRR